MVSSSGGGVIDWGALQILSEGIVENVRTTGDFRSLLFMPSHTDGETEAQRAEPLWEPIHLHDILGCSHP